MMPFLDVAPSEGPLVLTEHDADEVVDLYARCIDYFMLQDEEPATLADAIELFRDVPEEKSAVDQTVMGWRGQNGLVAVTLADAATEAGFADQSHVHRVFVARHGFTPGAFAGAFRQPHAILSKIGAMRLNSTGPGSNWR